MATKKVYNKSNNSPKRPKRKLKKLIEKESGIEEERPRSSSKKIEIQESSKKEAENKITQFINNHDNNSESDLSDDDLMAKLKMEIEEEAKVPKKKKSSKKESQKKKSANKKKEIKKKSIFSDSIDKPLKGKKFVFTGIFKLTKERDDLIELVKSLGGRVTTAVSGVTDVLVHGYTLEDGRDVSDSKKYKTAVAKGTIILDEIKFSDALKEKTKKSLKEHFGNYLVMEEDDNENYMNSFNNLVAGKINEDALIDVNDIIDIEIPDDKTNKLWVEKYKPKYSSQIIGNNLNIKNLKNWLKDWYTHEKSSKKHQKLKSKAVLISGPPGIGKTTAAILIAKECGYNAITKNASDLRNKKKINTLLKVLSSNKVLNTSGTLNKCVIIMDEVDGMKGDRGGISELINQIKETNQPIICICNDRQSKVMRSLGPYCFDLKFKIPSAKDIFKLIQMIITHERGADVWNHVDKAVLMNVVENSKSDVRQIISYLEMWLVDFDPENNRFEDISKFGSKDKFSFCNPFEATKKILNFKFNKDLDYEEMRRYFFSEYGLMDVFIYENYLTRVHGFNKGTVKKIEKKSKRKRKRKRDFFEEEDDGDILFKINKAIDSIAYGDIISKKMKTSNNYYLLNDLCFFGAIKPTLCFARSVDFPQFPSYLAKIQSVNKRRRLLTELKDSFTTSSNVLSYLAVINYSKVLSNMIAKLMNENKFDELYDLTRNYDLNPIMIKENLSILMEFYLPNNDLNKIATRSKTKFTKFYNSKMSQKNINSKKSKSKTKSRSEKKIEKNEQSQSKKKMNIFNLL